MTGTKDGSGDAAPDTSTRTLGHYDSRAEAFWAGTRDHDVRQNIEALLRHLELLRPPA